MITFRRIAALVLTMAALILAAQTNAHAVAADATDRPEILWPLPPNPMGSGPTLLAIQGKGYDWGIRKFANEVDPQLGGVLIFTGGCKAHPHATCLRVHKADFGDNGMYAWTTFSDEKGHRDIFLNTHYQDASGKYADICHEFGHVLGMGHHKKLGVDGRTGGVIHLSRPEKRALRKAY